MFYQLIINSKAQLLTTSSRCKRKHAGLHSYIYHKSTNTDIKPNYRDSMSEKNTPPPPTPPKKNVLTPS